MSWTRIFTKSPNRITDKDCTDEQVAKQSSLCKERYMKWKECKSISSYQDCKSEVLEDYYTCVDRLNAMRLFLEDKAVVKAYN